MNRPKPLSEYKINNYKPYDYLFIDTRCKIDDFQPLLSDFRYIIIFKNSKFNNTKIEEFIFNNVPKGLKTDPITGREILYFYEPYDELDELKKKEYKSTIDKLNDMNWHLPWGTTLNLKEIYIDNKLTFELIDNIGDDYLLFRKQSILNRDNQIDTILHDFK